MRSGRIVETLNARSMLNDATSAVNHAPVERRRRLSQAALAVASQMVRPAYSPIVIAGVVRLTDFISLSLVGIGIYFGHGDQLPGCRYLSSSDVPRSARPDDADDLGLGLRVPVVHRRLILRQGRQRDLAAVARSLLCRRACRLDHRAVVAARADAKLGAP